MLIYWLMFCFPGIFALNEKSTENPRENRFTFVWVATAMMIAIIVGFRWKTGGDWGNYYRDIITLSYEPWSLNLHRDLGYGQLGYLGMLLGNGMLVVTIFSGIIMGIALTRFSLAQPRPWLCLTICVPYLILVLGMGYIRQGIAVSFILIGILALREGRVLTYSAWAAVGALFHSTGAILLPLGALVSSKNRAFTMILGGIASLFAIRELLIPKTNQFITGYVDAEMDSSGALVRLAMTALPALLFLVFRKNFKLAKTEQGLWTLMAGASIMLFLSLFVIRSSTVVDRIGLYFLPLQCYVYSRLPDALGKTDQARRLITVSVVLLYAVAFFTWLYFSSHAYLWIPYRFYFFEDGLCVECRDV